jgi:hypothetical protein
LAALSAHLGVVPVSGIANKVEAMTFTHSDTLTYETPASVRGAPNVILRAEGAVVLLVSLVAYADFGGRWLWFAALFLIPDVTMLGYRFGPRIGAAVYNAGHSYIGVALLAGIATYADNDILLLGAVIWAAHIGFDRLLGYGLKYDTAFGHTHLGIKPRKG